ncbi:aminotransferase class V-fold PLP-dependent enzyme [Tessaracoccus palaemonis]|uniref:Aminotransferase class V-fold PLP-dependent enzyme n=1 Tax=Tessaracoccus palaemonis TaxID=2829499 RepID=A0ABX8SIS4_9ACTN|nr:aminotransferase class V-fold PLP-dependent enzyme [Tessaracoccus palaemonis]QXT62779.1 aminotransferase class V-fold PLP-dependent enzyme [Tessaracoccus palaemonis]
MAYPSVLDPELRWTLDPCVKHLNHGSFGAVPVAVQEEQNRLRSIAEWNPVRWFASMPPRVAAAREELADLLHVERGHLALVQNASAGASVVYQSLMTSGPVDVLLTDHGYGAITMGAQRLATRTGGTATEVAVPLDASADDVLARMTTAMDEHRPRLLVIDQITSATAREFPVDEICRAARERGVLTLVDGAHAPGVLADPVCREADYWVGNLHKFVCAPRGAALLVARGDGQELFPLIDSWGAQLPFPQRFDHTGTLDLTPWLVAPFAWRHLDSTVGWAEIRRRSRETLDEGIRIVSAALEGLVERPVPDVGQPVGPLRLLALPGTLGSTHDEADALRVPFGDATGIAMAFTEFGGKGYLRLSAHLYNGLDDYQYLAAVGIPLLHRWSQESTRGSHTA